MNPRREQILVQRCARGAITCSEPVAYVLLGLLGSAVEWIPELIAAACRSTGVVRISFREILMMHPDVPQVLSKDFDRPELDGRMLSETAAAVDVLFRHAVKGRMAVICEYSGLEALGLGELLGSLGDAGYRVHLLWCSGSVEQCAQRLEALGPNLELSTQAQAWWVETFGVAYERACARVDPRRLLTASSLSVLSAHGERRSTLEPKAVSDLVRLLAGVQPPFVPASLQIGQLRDTGAASALAAGVPKALVRRGGLRPSLPSAESGPASATGLHREKRPAEGRSENDAVGSTVSEAPGLELASESDLGSGLISRPDWRPKPGAPDLDAMQPARRAVVKRRLDLVRKAANPGG